MKVCINSHGHMTKMATMAINNKNLKSSSSELGDQMILKLGMKHKGMEI